MKTTVIPRPRCRALARFDLLTMALEEGKLLVWVGINRDDASLRTVAKKFTDDLGVECTVELVDPDLAPRSSSRRPPPAMALTWCCGRMTASATDAGGLISPVEPSPAIESAFLNRPRDAVSFGGKTSGLPGIRGSHRATLQQGHLPQSAHDLRRNLHVTDPERQDPHHVGLQQHLLHHAPADGQWRLCLPEEGRRL